MFRQRVEADIVVFGLDIGAESANSSDAISLAHSSDASCRFISSSRFPRFHLQMTLHYRLYRRQVRYFHEYGGCSTLAR